MVISNIQVYGIENAVRGSKFPMSTDIKSLNSDIVERTKKLGQSPVGAAHDQFLTGCLVQFDLTFTVKAWTEAERYHFFDFISSQSTMHRITKFDLDKAYIEYVDPRIIEIIKDKVSDYNYLCEVLAPTVEKSLEVNKRFTEEDKKKFEEQKKRKYLEILYSNPCGFKLTAAMTTNYRQLKTIYYQRKNHRLPEWREFCSQIEQLPCFKELVLGEDN